VPVPPFEKYIIEPFNMSEPQFWSFMKNYMDHRIDAKLLHSFYDYDLLMKNQTDGYERHFLKLTAAGTKETLGVALVNVDYTAQGEYRAYIRHLTTTDAAKIQTAIDQVVEFIWKNIYCQHIRLELYHQTDAAGKIQADPEMKAAFTKVGFKWKTLTNDPVTGKRAQIMQLNRPATAPKFEGTELRLVDAGKEPVTIKAGMVMELSSEP
jgi:hypothetical protein